MSILDLPMQRSVFVDEREDLASELRTIGMV